MIRWDDRPGFPDIRVSIVPGHLWLAYGSAFNGTHGVEPGTDRGFILKRGPIVRPWPRMYEGHRVIRVHLLVDGAGRLHPVMVMAEEVFNTGMWIGSVGFTHKWNGPSWNVSAFTICEMTSRADVGLFVRGEAWRA